MADQPFDYPKASPLLSVSFPDKWDVYYLSGGLFAASPDENRVFVEILELKATLDNPAEAIKEAKTTMEEFKNMKYGAMGKSENNGLGITIIHATGEDSEGKTFINLVLLAKPGAKNFILLNCFSSKAGSEKHGAAIGALIGSLKAK